MAICGDPGFVNRAARQPAADWRNVQPREVQVGDSKVLGISGELEVDALVLVFALADPSCEDADGWDAPDKRRGIDAHDVGVGQPEAEQPEVFVAGVVMGMLVVCQRMLVAAGERGEDESQQKCRFHRASFRRVLRR